MPTLAIAGGTSAGLGRAIVTAVISSEQSSWNIVILSRNPSAPLWLRAIDKDGTSAQIHPVNYHCVDSLAAALNGVHTVVSVTSAVDGSQAKIQINLLEAAVKAGCKRFAPSQWGFGPIGSENISVLKWGNEGVWDACVKQKDKIESAKFNIGSFMNYIGHGIYPIPSPTSDEETTLRQNGVAELPQTEDGRWPRISMTSLRDVGRFVAASLDLPEWEEDMTMVGDTLTMGELLTHAEAVTGKKFQVDVIKPRDLEMKLSAQDDFMGLMWAEFKLAYTRDLEDEVVLQPVVNRLCPAIIPMSARQYMEEYWSSV
ncbi:Pc12g02920 [Penicillium rubens Wisconsin 54-1255]|uniref:Pc12g02920 protein n=1 Tax=Penicillium rubens (strain ATCC 28089 / DSM 1075 / NRRL 1951 / Wisconsin 54-1255) TaxID=500485 RepID=B6H0D2_PENRW|nr:Pc12g02920 [Penicillium rubens Wisconsin 54-1255]